MDDDGKTALGWQELLGMGAVIAAVIAVGMGLGWMVDELVNTVPIFILIGLALGIVGAVAYTVAQFRKYLNS
jgi:F0F1-type ATP synthase assembly protein I